MPRARNIKPGFFVNDELCELPALTRLLFVGLWCMADKCGRLLDRPKRIRLEILPADDCDVDAMLWELQRRGFIVRYECDGQSLIEVYNWLKHQRPHHTEKSSELVGSTHCRATIKATPDKANGSLTVKAPLSDREYPPDTGYLIPDTGYLIPQSQNQSQSQKSQSQNTLSLTENLRGFEAPEVRNDGGEVGQVFAHWQAAMQKPRAALDDKRRKVIRKALLAGYGVADLCKAIDGCKASPWHMGQNERGKAFNTLELILRDAEKIDSFMGIVDAPPTLNRTQTTAERRAANIAILTGRANGHGNDNEPFVIDQ
jgi:hypothetical protein